ncbi:MAG: hypothetical protein V9G20_26595 [Candidatus Promineifilaceae bacterium]
MWPRSPFHHTITGLVLGVAAAFPCIVPLFTTITGPILGVAAAFPPHFLPFSSYHSRASVGCAAAYSHTLPLFITPLLGQLWALWPRSPNLHPFHHTITGPASGVAAAFPPTPSPLSPTITGPALGVVAAFPLANPLSCTITGPALGIAAAFSLPTFTIS